MNLFSNKEKNNDQFDYYSDKSSNEFIKILKNSGLMFGIIIVATLLSLLFRSIGFHESNFIMTYLLATFIVSNLTEGYIYGILASIQGVLVFNYFFTEPYYTLITYSPEYPVTFVFMLFVSLTTSTLTGQAKRESRRAELREQRLNVLYQFSRKLLSVKTMNQVAEVSATDISQLFNTSVIVVLSNIQGEMEIKHTKGSYLFDSEKDIAARTEVFFIGTPCGSGTNLFRDIHTYYFPVSGQSGVLGIIGLYIRNDYHLSDDKKAFLNTLGAQIALVTEREHLYEKQHKVKVQMEHERLRGDLLSSVAHDLRTPLTSILGSTSTIIENYNILDDELKLEFLNGIFEEAGWLSSLVENILIMTRFESSNIVLNKNMELVEEIVAEAVLRVSRNINQHKIIIDIPEELLLIEVDGILIEQVLVNLLNNSVKHAPNDSNILISVVKDIDQVFFSVSNDGPVIPEEALPHIFDRYYTIKDNVSTRHGFGLGLAICKSIVEAHGGNISVANKKPHGVVFKFNLPIKE